MRRIVALLVLAAAPLAGLAQSQIGLWLGRTSDDEATDVVRLIYRRPLNVEGRAWWCFGAYVLSKTVNNDTTSLPTSFQFGSHVGTGLALKNASVGVAFQHLSNAGIKQPNGGINFYLATVSLDL